MDNLELNSIVEGTVTGIVSFGAFVDIGVEKNGLIHISNISDEYIKDINEFLKVGQKVKVQIINIDKKLGRISLKIVK